MSHAGLWPLGRVALALAARLLALTLGRGPSLQTRRVEYRSDSHARPATNRYPPPRRSPGGARPLFAVVHRRLPRTNALTEDLAAAIAKRPGWAAVVFPIIPLGSDGANRIGGKYVFPGSYSIRSTTLRAVFMDLATEFGEQGFRWLFVIHGHGSPNHNRALDQAGDYFRDTYGGHMVNLTGLQPGPSPVDSVLASEVSKAALAEDGFTVHAGLVEHSTAHGSAARPRTRGGGERTVGDRKRPRRSAPNRGWRQRGPGTSAHRVTLRRSLAADS